MESTATTTKLSTLQTIQKLASGFSGETGQVEGNLAYGLAFQLYAMENKESLLADKDFWKECKFSDLKCFYNEMVKCSPGISEKEAILNKLVKEMVEKIKAHPHRDGLVEVYDILLKDHVLNRSISLLNFIPGTLGEIRDRILVYNSKNDLLLIYKGLNESSHAAASSLTEMILEKLQESYFASLK